jgi:sugar/nucleoside kinase (ribokinase family)
VLTSAFVKCTGAGDTLTGAVATELSRGKRMGTAVRSGLAAAHIAVQSPVGVSTISAALSREAVEAVAARDVPAIDEEYA